jgi:nitroreductase
VGLTSIYWREAWKYGIRAFRYCNHDCGHAIAAVAYAAAALGWRVRYLAEASDAEVARLLGLDRDADFADAEREHPDCLLWVGAGAPPALAAIDRLVAGATWAGAANRLSPSHRDWPDIDHAHAATVKPRVPLAAPFTPTAPPPSRAPRLDLAAATIVRQRRSAVDFDGTTAIDAEAFYAMLEPLVPRAGVPPWDAWPHAPRVHLALFVHRVEGLDPGLYVFARDPEAVARLQSAMSGEWVWQKRGPPDLALHLLTDGDARAAARTVSCHQDIAADACFALAMLADFDLARHAPWRYRELHWECGIIGQVLYLEAEAAAIRATGIGCFFDDALHRLLGLRGDEWQTLYHFTAGGAVEDERLTTLPAYSFPARARLAL